MNNLDSDLARILNVGAKVYCTETKRQGKVYSNNQIDIIVDYAKGKYETYKIDAFTALLTSDTIVSYSRITQGSGDDFKIKPREKSDVVIMEGKFTPSPKAFSDLDKAQSLDWPEVRSKQEPLEVAYINFPTGRFSKEPKKGYTKVEYRKSVEKVTIEVDSEMLQRLRDLGLLK